MANEEISRLSRLTALLTLLQSRRGFSGAELADKFGVSVRTVYRDIRALEEAGIPVLVEDGKGYSIVEGYLLRPVMFTEEEANAMITVEKMVARNKDASLVQHYSQALDKIKSVLQNRTQERANLLSDRIIFRQNQEEDRTSHNLTQLQKALTHFQVVQIEYHSLEKLETTTRRLEPFAMYSTQENWLLIAFCRLRNDFRAFRLDRIQRIEILDEFFTPHLMTLQEYFEQCREKYLAGD